MISHAKNFITGLSRLTLMGSVALPSFTTAAIGLGVVSTSLFIAHPAEAAVIIGNRNKLKEKPRRNYKSTVRIDRDLLDASGEVSVTGIVRFYGPDGTEGPVRDLNLEPAESSHLSMENPVFQSAGGAMNNVLSASVSGGDCDGSEINVEVPFASKTPVDFTLCEAENGTITGTARFTNKGKPRVNFTVPFDKAVRSDLYGRIIIKGEPLEMERTVYTGDINDVEPGAVAGFTYEQTITVKDAFGNTLDSQTVRGIVGEDNVDVMGPAHVIIGDRNRIKERPRRNYRSVSVTQQSSFNGEIGIEDKIFRIDEEFVYTHTVNGGGNGPFIPETVINEPARVNTAFTYGDGPTAGDTLFGGFCGGSFALPVGGVEDDSTDIIDDMGGSPIEGTALKARANKRLDGTLRLNVKGDYRAIENCEASSLFVENTSGEPIDNFTNYIWEGEIDADPRTFDDITYERTAALTDRNGTVLDRFIDLITLNAPEETTLARASYGIIGNRNRLKQRPRRNYKATAVSTGPAQGERDEVELHFVLGNAYDGLFGEVGGDITSTQIEATPAVTVYNFEVPTNGVDTISPDPWCGVEFEEPLALNQDVAIKEDVFATISQANNGNYRVKVKDRSDNQYCGKTDHLRVAGIDAYDLGATQTWTTTFPDFSPDLPADQKFFLETRLVNKSTSEILHSTVKSVTANDVLTSAPQLTSVELVAQTDGFDRGVQAVFDGRVVAENLPQNEASLLSYRFLGEGGTVLAESSNVTTCHIFAQSNVTFADSESVMGHIYLVELTASNNHGDELDYLEFDIVGEERKEDIVGSTFSGNNFTGTARFTQNDDGETYELAVGICGNPNVVNEVAIFMTPQEGGSDLDPEDFTLDFINKLAFLENSDVEQGSFDFTQGAFFEVRLGTEGDNNITDVWKTSLANDPECTTTCACTHLRGTQPSGQDTNLTVHVCHLRETALNGSGNADAILQSLRETKGKLSTN